MVVVLLLYKYLLLMLSHGKLLKMLVALMIKVQLSLPLQVVQSCKFLLSAFMGVHLKMQLLLLVRLLLYIGMLLSRLHG